MRVSEQKAACRIADGEVWTKGGHYFACGDLEDGAVLGKLLYLAPEPTLLYSDPPWFASQARYYRTLSEREQEARAVNWAALLQRVLRPAQTRGLLAYIEMSTRTRERARQIARDMGAATEHWWPVQWSTYSATLFTADFRPGGGEVSALVNPRAKDAPVEALSGHPQGVVLDPCTGQGWTTRAAVKLGWTFVGHELTPRRLWVAMSRVKGEAERVA
jgi:hypothetical protein